MNSTLALVRDECGYTANVLRAMINEITKPLGALKKENPLVYRIHIAIYVGTSVAAAIVSILWAVEWMDWTKFRGFLWICVGLYGLNLVTTSLYGSSAAERRRDDFIARREEEARQSPEKTKATWDLAQIKLESYLDRNLSQVRSIFWLCTLVMLFGFLLVSYGAFGLMNDRASRDAGILSAVSGILISFMGGSFLFIYKSTMTQARDYVTMLERINAVGMSLQIIDSLDAHVSGELKSNAKADLARELLKIYDMKRP